VARKFYKKPRRRSALTTERKARSLQTSWRRYTKETLTIAKAKDIIAHPPQCPYCHAIIDWQKLSIDHVQPTSRGGENTPSNLVYSCNECNRTKGDLTGDEYIALLAFLDQWPMAKRSVLDRLRAAGAVYGRYKRRQK
jgi:5-methylcytosine-specific restriction endonuclease McrA